MNRGLSGIYFREKQGNKWINLCFEECSEEKQDEILDKVTPEFVKNLCKGLANTLKNIGDKLDIVAEQR